MWRGCFRRCARVCINSAGGPDIYVLYFEFGCRAYNKIKAVRVWGSKACTCLMGGKTLNLYTMCVWWIGVAPQMTQEKNVKIGNACASGGILCAYFLGAPHRIYHRTLYYIVIVTRKCGEGRRMRRDFKGAETIYGKRVYKSNAPDGCGAYRRRRKKNVNAPGMLNIYVTHVVV